MNREFGPLELLLCTATSLGEVGTFRWDLATDEVSLSERALSILGLTGEEPRTSDDVIERVVQAGERARVHELRDRARAEAAAVPTCEWQMDEPGREPRWLAMRMAPAYEGARVAEMVGGLLDVTDRHEWIRERELYRSAFTALAGGADPSAVAAAVASGLSGATPPSVEALLRPDRAAQLGESPLTARETEVLQMASHGGSSAKIGERLQVSTSTVKTHFEHIYAKLGVADRAGAVAEALRRGLIV